MKENVYCFDDSNAEGEYSSLSSSIWKRIEHTVSHKRINVGVDYLSKSVRVFVQKSKDVGEVKITDDEYKFDKKHWVELRMVRGESLGLPLEVQDNGTIWVGEKYSRSNLEVFAKV